MGSAQTVTILGSSMLTAPDNGYAYIYVSNESRNAVFIDNFQVVHQPGRIVQDVSYYPFGMQMEGISSGAANGIENKFKYNGKEEQRQEFADGSGLELYDFGARMQNPQLGRWWTVDPMADKMRRWSSYNYAFDNPLRFIDKDGMEATDWIKNDKTRNYEWRNEVTSVGNTPAGYTYIGKQDNDIVQDLGYSTNATTVTTTKRGAIHADVEEGSAEKHIASYTAAHAVEVTVSTTTQVNADVTTTFDKNMNMSKTFNGLREDISMRVTTKTEEKLTTTAKVNFKSGGQAEQLYLGEPAPSHNGDIKQVGTTYLNGSITMTPAQAAQGMSFPLLNISGSFFRPTNEEPAYVRPTILSGQLNMLAPLKYSQYIMPIIPQK